MMVPVKNRDSPYDRIYAVIARIPPGRVATYGQIAALAGLPRQARRVGHALRIQPDGAGLPWHRVINAQGGISDRGMGWEAGYQRHLLEEEGVVFDARGGSISIVFAGTRTHPLPGGRGEVVLRGRRDLRPGHDGQAT